MHCLLLGNGLNRLSMPIGWRQLLEQLAADLGLAGQVAYGDRKPLSLHFEELCIRLAADGKVRDAEHEVKKHIAKLMDRFPVHPLHMQIAGQFQTILTTNYDDTIELALGGPLREPDNVLPESRYSLFRRTCVGTRSVWHVHGEASRSQTILLGYDHYAGYLQKIRNYLTGSISVGERRHVRSPLRSGLKDFEGSPVYAWVDLFLRDHVHIVGFGFDFSEIDLWWLLVYKRRRDTQTGRTFFYVIQSRGCETPDEAKLALLESMGIDVVRVEADSYEEGYCTIALRVEQHIARHGDWLRRTGLPRPAWTGAVVAETNPRRHGPATEQGRLKLVRRHGPRNPPTT